MSLEDFESVKRWFDSLRARGCSEETFTQYRWGFGKFLDWAKTNPDQLIQERAQDLASQDPMIRGRAEGRLMKFISEEEGLTKYTRKHISRMVQSFFKANYVPLSLIISTPMPVREHDFIPTSEDIQKMVQACSNPRDQALLMLLSQTGLRIGTAVELRWKHIKDEFNGPEPILIHVPSRPTRRKKGGYVTFIASDARHYLARHLLGQQMADEDFIFNMDKATGINVIRRAGKKIGIIKEQGLSEFRSHSFRKRIQTLLEKAGIPLNWCDYLLGHEPRGAQAGAYSRPSVEDLRKAYAQALPLIRIF